MVLVAGFGGMIGSRGLFYLVGLYAQGSGQPQFRERPAVCSRQLVYISVMRAGEAMPFCGVIRSSHGLYRGIT